MKAFFLWPCQIEDLSQCELFSITTLSHKVTQSQRQLFNLQLSTPTANRQKFRFLKPPDTYQGDSLRENMCIVIINNSIYGAAQDI